MEELSEKLASELSKRNEVVSVNPAPHIIDEKPRSMTNTDKAEEDRKFKRVLTKWMTRELEKGDI